MPKDLRPVHKTVPNSPGETGQDPAEYDSIFTLLARVYWAGFGPVLLLLSLATVGQGPSRWLTAADVVYFVLLALLPLSRWLEFSLGKGQTADGKPVTLNHLRTYSAVVVVCGFLAWVLAKAIGNYLLVGNA